MNKKHFNQFVFVTLSILIIAMLSVGGAAGSDPPAVPAAYYGEIDINDEQAPAGIVIEAEIDDEVRGSIVTDKGSFGGPNPRDTKLVVNGSSSDGGSKVTVRVYPEVSTAGTA